jgi:hypothetical protein
MIIMITVVVVNVVNATVAPATTPAYLSVDGWKDCLKERNSQLCMPNKKSSKCKPDAWAELQQKFKGEKCPERDSKLSAAGKCREMTGCGKNILCANFPMYIIHSKRANFVNS